MTTLVSAFVANANNRIDRNIDDYIAYGKKLLETDINKIVFIDEEIIEKFHNLPLNTIIIPINKTYNYLYQYIEQITNFQLNTTCPEKDTIEYMITICNKTEYVRKAIELNPFQSSQFIWVDFGINHVFQNDNANFNNTIVNLKNKSYDNIRIASIWNLEHAYMINIYKDIAWYFAGGVFGGNPEALIKFANLTKTQCIKIIEEHQTLMWEVNVWFNVFTDNKELYSPYLCDHNSTILDNY